MTPAEALAELEKLAGRPTTRERIWDSLTHDERQAIVFFAHGRTSVLPTDREYMTREYFDRCWHVLERFARLSVRLTVAADNARAEEAEQARELIGIACSKRSAA